MGPGDDDEVEGEGDQVDEEKLEREQIVTTHSYVRTDPNSPRLLIPNVARIMGVNKIRRTIRMYSELYNYLKLILTNFRRRQGQY